MNHWKPHPNNIRNNSGRRVGYVLAKKYLNNNNNIIKFYTRVILNGNKWKPDPAYRSGNFYKKRNGSNFNLVTKLFGYYPVQTTLRWSNVPKPVRRAPSIKKANSPKYVPSNFVMPSFPGI